MKLDGIEEIKSLDFDIPNRKLTVYHFGNLRDIEKSIHDLNFNASLIKTESVESLSFIEVSKNQSKLLWTVLLINFVFFVIEVVSGFLSRSMGLVSDSLDMLADSLVYGLSLYAVGSSVSKKKNVAKISGYFQLVLALFGFAEVVRRFLGYEKVPDFATMVIISVFALLANVICLYLLQKSNDKEAHMQASMIFTSNDIVINLSVIAAGFLVYFLNSKYPDLIIGTAVFIIVARGAFRILNLAK
ncbi:Co/Zn/Cd efflux system protein [Sporocytophaga myxococcoides]|uniref:Co/Zn/Cd efflux system protein n=2 Tax=Sporocytophaga myxococcoides TaxID=153721 RepID=A0A098LIU4_9BACT|nr:Co/Zn/Cd efflux system protein [Sporocytophaga myxococcoides]